MIGGSGFTLHCEKIELKDAYAWLKDEGFVSAISSEEVAYLFGSVLQIPLSTNNLSISLKSGDQAILGLYKGPKIRSRQSRLTYGATITWYLLTVD
jgi:hypothetical protein